MIYYQHCEYAKSSIAGRSKSETARTPSDLQLTFLAFHLPQEDPVLIEQFAYTIAVFQPYVWQTHNEKPSTLDEDSVDRDEMVEYGRISH